MSNKMVLATSQNKKTTLTINTAKWQTTSKTNPNNKW
jgi:hypothetical protein